jgi:hypothetical protein
MSEVLIPTWIIPEDEQQEPLDEGSSVFAAAFAPGLAQRQSYGGLRLKLSRRHTVRAEEKAQLLSILRSTRGRYNALRSKVHFALRGSFPATELLSNNTFASGTTNWTTNTSFFGLSVADRILRSTRIAQDGASHNGVNNSGTAGLVIQYAPYVARAFVLEGKGVPATFTLRLGSTTAGEYGESATTGFGLKTLAAVAAGTAASVHIVEGAAGALPGDYTSIPYISLSRCALVDNGTNMALQSDEFDATWAATRASVDDQAGVAPDGASTADSIIEDSSASTTHYVQQNVTVSSSASDYSLAVALKAGGRNYAQLAIIENTGSESAVAYFDLAIGVVGDSGSATNMANHRAFIRSMGNGWYYCCLVAHKTNAATVLSSRISLASGSTTGSVTYTGNGTSNILAWRATLAQSGVPTRLIATTTTASTGTSQTGSALHVKGLPVSTSGLLLPEDVVEINGELKTCTAALNSDAAGLGYLQFEPPLFRSPADNDPVIILDPMGKFLMSNLKIDNEFGTQALVSYDLEHIYE